MQQYLAPIIGCWMMVIGLWQPLPEIQTALRARVSRSNAALQEDARFRDAT
jgi:hypothetical protein